MRFVLCLLVLLVFTACSEKKPKYSLVLTNLSGDQEVVADFYQSQSHIDCVKMLESWRVNYPDAICKER